MNNSHGYQQYAANTAMTASPEKLLVMAYDGMVRFLNQAEEAMQKKDYSLKNDSIQRVQQILGVLQAGLRPDVHPELCKSLSSLYEWFTLQLADANIKDDMAILHDIKRRIADLRDVWAKAEAQLHAQNMPHPGAVPQKLTEEAA